MPEHNQGSAYVRTALFVDFDNIYLGLQNEDPGAAEQFATHPGRWLRWLQDYLPCEVEGTEGRSRRKILFRRCYLNPSQFSRFRPYFIRSAFEVVDCPPLTRGGKTSADIQMVMDILDALGHATRFDEFIILSGDADFTPVLLRLSKHDRRSVVLAAGPASAAYKAACDLVIDQDTFLEEAIEVGEGATPRADPELLLRIADKVRERAGVAGELIATDLPAIFREFPEFTPDSNWLGFYSLRAMANAVVRTRGDLSMHEGDPWRVRVRMDGVEGAVELDTIESAPPAGPPAPRPVVAAPFQPSVGPEVLRRIADKVYERASASGELVATDLPAIFREFPEFTPNSNWLGCYSLRSLTGWVARSRVDLEMVDGDPWRVRVRSGVASEELEPEEAPSAGETAPEAGVEAADTPAVDNARLTERILQYVSTIVEGSDAAVPMSRAAQLVIGEFGDDVLHSRWAGAGTFRDLLVAQEAPDFAISPVKPGYVYHPDLHQSPTEEGPDEFDVGDAELSSLAHRIHRLTDTPYLTPEEYGLVFRKIAEEANENGYFLTRTSKAVRDRCIEEGTPIARASVNFILRGITFAGQRFDQNGPSDPLELGNSFVKNVLGLCETAGLPLAPDERETLSRWILGDLEPAAAKSR
ncbi:MAG TPA: NYN domain-containing protein [Thermoanaerobaculia bacterium]